MKNWLKQQGEETSDRQSYRLIQKDFLSQDFSTGALGAPWGHGAVLHKQRPLLNSSVVMLQNPKQR